MRKYMQLTTCAHASFRSLPLVRAPRPVGEGGRPGYLHRAPMCMPWRILEDFSKTRSKTLLLTVPDLACISCHCDDRRTDILAYLSVCKPVLAF